ncbi:type VI secretion system ImpH/TssG family protein/type VI secretion system VasI/ImpG family protein [Paraburkholderia sp. BL6665CI2N2]|nr:type VI secretion system ImpH/TssG family protein/type VI secretion system VasI/ImpG family protein [Paraburkholderia sp. BL6665CI2N2]
MREVNGRLKIRLLSLGMLGPNGPLPIHMTEIAREREQNRRDATLVNFLDIFHHRYLTLLYRAWASAQAAAGLDRKDDETFSFFVASLAGHDPDEIAGRPFPAHARLAASAHLVREARNPDGLRATLEQYFGVPVAIEEYVFHWLEMAPASHSYLGKPVESSTLAMGAMLGEQVPDRQHRFRIVLGPLDLQVYLRFTAQGVDLPKLVECVREFVGRGCRWELELRIKPQGAPPAVLGGTEQLGWSSWLGQAPTDAPITGMRFEPEQYVEQLARRSVPYRQRPETGAGDLLTYYNEELLYLRELAAEFAQAHVKIARRLGMQAGEIGDMYVERLVQAFAFMSARMRMKLDAAFPDFTRPLLQCLYPNYLAPTPSMAVARLYPDDAEGDLAEGVRIARGATFISRVSDGETTACEFRSSQEVTLYPLEIVSARLTGIPPDIPAPDRYARGHTNVRGALRLRLRTTSEACIADLQGLDRLPVYLAGEERLASRLFELLHVAAVASITGEPENLGTPGSPFHAVSRDAVVHEGLDPGQSLLPLAGSKFHGHNLLHEFSVCPSRFYFFTLTGLAPGLRQVRGREAEVVVLLDRHTDPLAYQVDASQFALFCTPVINLFPRTSDPVELPKSGTEFQLVPNALQPLDYEVFSVQALHGQVSETSAPLQFRPLHEPLTNDEGNHGRYFTSPRERRSAPELSRRRYGTRTPYVGTQTSVSLVDHDGQPYGERMNYLTLSALLTNRELPNLIVPDGRDDLTLEESAPVLCVGLIRSPSVPRAPYAERETAWRLIRQLNFSYLALEDPSAAGLRNLLGLFLAPGDEVYRQMIDSLVDVSMRTVTRMLPGDGQIMFGCGAECVLTVDEAGFHGVSPYLFGLILERFLARGASAHSFIETELRSTQRGPVATWPVRMGTRGVA